MSTLLSDNAFYNVIGVKDRALWLWEKEDLDLIDIKD